MKKSNFLSFIIIILILIKVQDYTIINTSANPTPVRIIGGFLPKENVSLSLTEANVLIEVEAINYPDIIRWNFEGNYTIYNPNNSIEITIAFPFYMSFVNNISLRVNGNPIDIDDVISLYNVPDIWNSYMDDLSDTYYRNAYICNITFPTNDSLNVQFNLNSYSYRINDYFDYVGKYDIVYDVGTSRIWNGNITEKVEFRIQGRQPDYCYYANQCNISENEDGKSYIWAWNNEIININLVGISYLPTQLESLYFIIFMIIIIIAGIIGITFFIIKKSRLKNIQEKKNHSNMVHSSKVIIRFL